MAAVVSDAANTRDELTEILREQAETCDEEVNHLTDEVDALTAALSESASENLRLRWRWAAKASWRLSRLRSTVARRGGFAPRRSSSSRSCSRLRRTSPARLRISTDFGVD